MIIAPFRSLAGPWILTRFTALPVALPFVILAGCTIERPTEAPSGMGADQTVGTVDCSSGCKDTFTDANGTLLTAHSPDVGGFAWKYVEGSGGDYQAKITNNAVSIEDADSLDHQFMYVIPEIVGEDTVEIEVEVFGDPITMRGIYNIGVVLRADGTLMGGYAFHLGVWLGGSSGGSTSVDLAKNGEFIPGSDRALPPPFTGDSQVQS